MFLNFYHDIPKIFRRFKQPTYTYLEYAFLTWVIWYHLKSTTIRRLISFSSVVFLLFLIFYNIFTKLQKMDSIPIGVETILILLYSFYFFQQFLRSNIAKNVYEYPSFWLVVGLLVYLGCNFFFNLLFNHVSSEQIENFWHYTYLPEIVKNVLFSLVILGYPSYSNENNNVPYKSNDIPNLDMI